MYSDSCKFFCDNIQSPRVMIPPSIFCVCPLAEKYQLWPALVTCKWELYFWSWWHMPCHHSFAESRDAYLISSLKIQLILSDGQWKLKICIQVTQFPITNVFFHVSTCLEKNWYASTQTLYFSPVFIWFDHFYVTNCIKTLWLLTNHR